MALISCKNCAREECINEDMAPISSCFVAKDEDVMRNEMAADRLRDEICDEKGSSNE